MGGFFIQRGFMFKKLLLSLGILLSTAPALADGIEINPAVSPNISGKYVVRATIVTNNDAKGLKFALHKFENDRVATDEYPSVFRPNIVNTRAGQKRSIVISFDGKFEKPQNMAVCMYVDPPKPTETNASTMVANFRYCKIFKANP